MPFSKEKRKEYYLLNRENIIKKNREYYLNNKYKKALYAREYYQRKKSAIIESRKSKDNNCKVSIAEVTQPVDLTIESPMIMDF